MRADRLVLREHLNRGRVMFGVGPGALPSDAYMMGIEVARQRGMMEESLEAILELLAAAQPVTRTTDSLTLRDARLPPRPYYDPCLEIALAAQVHPSSPRLVGRSGTAPTSHGRTHHPRPPHPPP